MNLDSNTSARYATTEEQVADILTKGSCTSFHWNDLMGLVTTCAPQSDKISVCCASQPQQLPHKALVFWYLPVSQKREVSGSTDINFVISVQDARKQCLCRRASLEAVEKDPNEPSPRSILEEKRSGSAKGSSFLMAGEATARV